ncbi:protein-disulfide reductase DsbD domain-containing protein [Pseudooceanicola sp. C21-150M6]|uniref:protein-disulfide reductase DsbD domain-containing protein n=1 Tax=Pseudooceanicola sp. C21-150M6 TaxID=3434355 RepID=UPI003D7FBAF2
MRYLSSGACAVAFALASVLPALSETFADKVSVRVLPGWQEKDGSFVAALDVHLAKGWKTYWRAPGEAGLPPVFSWGGSENVQGVQVIWPRPDVFYQNGLRTIGYKERLVLPLRVLPGQSGGQVALGGTVEMGICEDVCVPLTVTLPPVELSQNTRRVPDIAAALAERPFAARSAGVGGVSCTVAPEGRNLVLTTTIEMPALSGQEVVVVEPGDATIWVRDSVSRRDGDRLVTRTELMDANGGAFALDRSALRLTVLGDARAVEIDGCSGS